MIYDFKAFYDYFNQQFKIAVTTHNGNEDITITMIIKITTMHCWRHTFLWSYLEPGSRSYAIMRCSGIKT